MDEAVRIKIADAFSETPFGRYYEDGDDSGQRFREEFLLPRLRKGQSIVLDIDDVAGLPSSFWEEALGGAVRAGISAQEMRRLLSIVATQSDLKTYIRIGWTHIDNAEKDAGRRLN